MNEGAKGFADEVGEKRNMLPLNEIALVVPVCVKPFNTYGFCGSS